MDEEAAANILIRTLRSSTRDSILRKEFDRSFSDLSSALQQVRLRCPPLFASYEYHCIPLMVIILIEKCFKEEIKRG